MAKKVKIKSNSVKYYEGDKVVVKTKSWNSEEFKLFGLKQCVSNVNGFQSHSVRSFF